jgi:hypothetical protein
MVDKSQDKKKTNDEEREKSEWIIKITAKYD